MKAARIISGLLAAVVTMPIWYYLLYRILQGVNASDVMWLLFWIYMPVGIFVNLLSKIVEMQK